MANIVLHAEVMNVNKSCPPSSNSQGSSPKWLKAFPLKRDISAGTFLDKHVWQWEEKEEKVNPYKRKKAGRWVISFDPLLVCSCFTCASGPSLYF